jgi:hypothetical protein
MAFEYVIIEALKYKYYFRKPRSEITKDILGWLAVAGVMVLAGGSPYLFINLRSDSYRWKKYKNRRVADTFSRLKKHGHIEVQRRNNQIYIHLTSKGKALAGWLQIDALQIKRPKRWDRKYRIIMFDIDQLRKPHREAFRGKLKELGFYPLQKSVWIHAFGCKDEVALLKDFFGLTDREVRYMCVDEIGNDREVRKFFDL